MQPPVNMKNPTTAHLRPLRIGFLGVGWIGFERMEALAASGMIEAAVVADPSSAALHRVQQGYPHVRVARDLDELLDSNIEGVVIATPSALHAQQTKTVLKAGLPVFCQKPLARTAAETRDVIETARDADRLLAIDFSYRYLRGVQLAREMIRQKELGEIHAAQLVFHNAYGPDKPWYRKHSESGGGCLMDLGVHLVDLAFDVLQSTDVGTMWSSMYAEGQRLTSIGEQVEDYVAACFDLNGRRTTVSLTCSWWMHAGRNAVIEATFIGTKGSIAVANVGGSFSEFTTRRFHGTTSHILDEVDRDWAPLAALEWAQRLQQGPHYRSDIERAIPVAKILGAIYDRAR